MTGIRICLLLGGLLGLAALQLPLYDCVSADGLYVSVSQFNGLETSVLSAHKPALCPPAIRTQTESLEAVFMTSSILPGILLLLAINSLSGASHRAYLAMALLGGVQCTVSVMACYLMRDQVDGLSMGSYVSGIGGLFSIVGSVRAMRAVPNV
ncbi:MAG: hypothetical protein CMH52_05885 [Myxococcales bacterium]|nr:hypothetical protein [Myxococcales bacterium]